jgi:glycosyltransferase involved in cell wall biosynthesis
LIKVLALLKDYHFRYKLWILGEGAERENLEKKIKENQLEEKIELLGFKRNPYVWLQQSDVFICSSRVEGYSLVIAEAMILGKPILSVDCAGPNELLGYGKYGVLVPNTDDDLQSMIYRLLSGNIDLEKYAQLSKKRQSFFELSHIMRRIEEMFLA